MLSGLRILVVNGDAETVALYRARFEYHRADVRVATNGKGALSHVRPAWLPHVLVTELRLPDMPAGELAKETRVQAGAALAVVCTIPGDRRPSAASLGFEACLVEPVELDDLCATIARVVEAGKR